MADKHPDQAEIAEYLAGVMDGDGWMTTEITKSNSTRSTGHIVSTRVGYEFYIAGLVDSDGAIDSKIAKHDGSALDYQHTPRFHFSIIKKEAIEVRERFRTYLSKLGLEPDDDFHERIRNMDNPNHRDQWVVRINKRDAVHTFLQSVKPYLVLKQGQAEIILNEIIPRIRRGEHTSKRGFLAVTAWRDVLNSKKGGLRGDYNLLYFEELWDMRIDLERHDLPADLRDSLPEPESD